MRELSLDSSNTSITVRVRVQSSCADDQVPPAHRSGNARDVVSKTVISASVTRRYD